MSSKNLEKNTPVPNLNFAMCIDVYTFHINYLFSLLFVDEMCSAVVLTDNIDP